MAGSRTLKLSLLADISDFGKNLNKASAETQSFGDRVGGMAKTAGIALAAAGAAAAAYATKLAIDGVKSAMEDEAAQQRLATTLKNVTGATNDQIAATEAWISQQQLALGVSDSALRPALDRLARSTKDIGEAQQLTALALDISAGSGKSLEAVANALGKAYEGNTAALGKLGVGISSAELKTLSFDQVTQQLAATFGGQASEQADTFQGKVARLSEAWNEAKETVGSFIIDALAPLLTLATDKLIPALGDIANKIGEAIGPAMSGIGDYIRDVFIPAFQSMWDFIVNILIPGIVKTFQPILEGLGKVFQTIASKIQENREKLAPLFELLKEVSEFVAKYLAPTLGKVLGKALEIVAEVIGRVIDLVSELIRKLTALINLLRQVGTAIVESPFGQALGAVGNWVGDFFRGLQGQSEGGIVTGPTPLLVGEGGQPEAIIPINRLAEFGLTGNGRGTVIVNVNGTVIDPEGAARAIQQLLTQSDLRMGGVYA